MARLFIFGALLLVISVLLAVTGCEKEKIVESTEYIREVEYIEVPPDTVFMVDTIQRTDTIFNSDSVIIHSTDTIVIFDTVVQVDYIYDTVTTVQYIYDTTFVTDTVQLSQSTPNEFVAFGAMQYYTDPMVIEMVRLDLGYTDGWIFYLSAWQAGWNFESSNIYDIYGFIDYWSPDWMDFYPLEFYWRMTYISGDPADPNNWQISEPPPLSADHRPGLKLVEDPAERSIPVLR